MAATLLVATRAMVATLYVADNGDTNIYAYTPLGVRSTYATGVGQPFGIAFDPNGNLFAAGRFTDNVYEICPTEPQRYLPAV